MQRHDSRAFRQLFDALASTRTPEEVQAFLEDLCTIKELQDMSQRFETAILLSEGKNYLEISSQVGISTATISRVSRSLNYGSGGYQAAIEKLTKAETIE